MVFRDRQHSSPGWCHATGGCSLMIRSANSLTTVIGRGCLRGLEESARTGTSSGTGMPTRMHSEILFVWRGRYPCHRASPSVPGGRGTGPTQIVELEDLVGEFRMHSVPLDVLVVDMDWHLTFNQRWGNNVRDQADQTLGWTGYTWDRGYFPDPDAFLHWCEDHGLKTTLNLHPASGIQPHEEQYSVMARAMGIDPSTKEYVPFDIVDKNFALNYFKYVIHPLERRGVDFWWLDWQQWGTTKIAGVTPTWWLNYVFFTDMERQGRARPILFHRWGGLGNHRYQVGFLRRCDFRLGIPGIPGLLHGDCGQCRVWLLEP